MNGSPQSPDPRIPSANATHSRRIAGNFGLLTAFKVLSDVFTFGLFVVLAQTFGETGIGQYSFAMGIAAGFAVFADFGLYRLSIKDLARRDDDFTSELASLFFLRLGFTFVVLAAMAVVVFAGPFDPQTRYVLLIVSLHQISYTLANGLNAIFIARQDMFLAAGLDACAKALAAIAGVSLAWMGFDLVTVLLALPAATFVQIAVSLFLVGARYGFSLRTEPGRMKRIVRSSLPFVSSTIVRYATIRSDVVLLGFMRNEAAVGIYNVAYRVLFLLMYIPTYATLAVLPVMSRFHHQKSPQGRELIQSSLGWMLLIGMPVSAGLWLIAEPFIHLVFSTTFDASIVILQILAWLFLFSCLRNMLSTILTSCDQQVTRVKLETVTAFIAVAGNIIMIAFYGARGAAVAVLASEIILVILLTVATRSMLDAGFLFARLGISALASAAFIVPVLFGPPLSIFVIVPVGMLIYPAVVLMFPTIRHHEWRVLKELRKSNKKQKLDE